MFRPALQPLLRVGYDAVAALARALEPFAGGVRFTVPREDSVSLGAAMGPDALAAAAAAARAAQRPTTPEARPSAPRIGLDATLESAQTIQPAPVGSLDETREIARDLPPQAAEPLPPLAPRSPDPPPARPPEAESVPAPSRRGPALLALAAGVALALAALVAIGLALAFAR